MGKNKYNRNEYVWSGKNSVLFGVLGVF